MLGQRRQKHKLAGNGLSIPRIKIDPIIITSFVMLIVACLYPEVSLASSMEAVVGKVGTFTNGPLKTVGFSAAGIGCALVALVKGNIKLALTMVIIGIVASLNLEWVKGGMTLTS